MLNYDDTPGKEYKIQAFSLGELIDDPKPISDDLIYPKILTSGGFLIISGTPEVGEIDFLLNFFAHMAGGLPFKDMIPPRPLKIFYLQAEFDYNSLRERLRKINPDALNRSRNNLFITSHLQRLILNDEGISRLMSFIQRRLNQLQPDIIAIDQFEYFYDSNAGDDNPNIPIFLQDRVKQFRDWLNPEMGIIITHRLEKMPKNLLELKGFTNVKWLKYPLD